MGAEVSRKLAKEGAKVLLVARGESMLAKVEKEIEDNKGKAKVYSCDIREPVQVRQTVKKIVEEFGGIDILVNNAGVWTDDELEKRNRI